MGTARRHRGTLEERQKNVGRAAEGNRGDVGGTLEDVRVCRRCSRCRRYDAECVEGNGFPDGQRRVARISRASRAPCREHDPACRARGGGLSWRWSRRGEADH
eukprot:gene15783-biopygen12263